MMRKRRNRRKPKIKRPLITPRAMMALWTGDGLLDEEVIVVAFGGEMEEEEVVVKVRKPPTPVTTSGCDGGVMVG